MDKEILLPHSQYIDISLGLKYLNGNKKLYLKILNSFLTRYKNFNINSIKKNELKNEMHTLKGLSSTLGMESLTDLVKELYSEQTEELLLDFSKTLQCIISDLNAIQTKTLLIINDNSDEIDTLIEIIEDRYDVIVTVTVTDAVESLSKENIDIVLLSPALNTPKIENILEQKKIFIINIHRPLDSNSLQLAIKNI